MKNFSFSLDKVLSYKVQIENSLRNEHAHAVQIVSKQEMLIRTLEKQQKLYGIQFDEEKKNGAAISCLRMYECYLEGIQNKISDEKKRLILYKKDEEEKRERVIEAKKDTSSITKLKDKKKKEYNALALKEEERSVEEFVSNTMAFGNQG